MNTQSLNTVPVTVLTGFLGSGKTTLLNRILTENHGKRIAVIENEFGEVGIDHELVVNADEEVFEMNNGCICCTVRGDLIRILGNLMKRRDKFDYILIETTGLADPGPVAQTFFVDDEMKEKLRLDGIVTLVDAKHIWQHLDSNKEAQEQIAFADVILLNKADLVPAGEIDRLEQRIRQMNAAAKIHRTQNAAVPLDAVLHVGGFNIERAMEVDAKFMEPEYPFEWGAVYDLAAGDYTLELQPGPDPAMNVALLPLAAGSLADALPAAVVLFSADEQPVPPGGVLLPGERLVQLQLGAGTSRYTLHLLKAGRYALFTQHHPNEFAMQLQPAKRPLSPGPVPQATLASRSLAEFRPVPPLTAVEAREFKPDHEHDNAVTSVGITHPGELHPDRLNEWLRVLLREKGADIFRMKGVLSIKGSPERFVFQGVHMLFDGKRDRPWGDEPRHNSLIFIGRNLNRAELNEGFRGCLA